MDRSIHIFILLHTMVIKQNITEEIFGESTHNAINESSKEIFAHNKKQRFMTMTYCNVFHNLLKILRFLF